MKGRIRAIVALSMTAVALASVMEPATAARKPTKHVRVITLAYQGSCALTASPSGHPGDYYGGATPENVCESAGNGSTFSTRRDERYIKVEVTDITGQRASVSIFPPSVYDGNTIEVCGMLKQARTYPSTQYNVYPEVYASPACSGAAIKGTIKITLSNLP